jgi:hypothetical protein
MQEKFDREKLIMEKVRMADEAEMIQTEAIKQYVLEFLKTEKGYLPEDIEIDKKFQISVSDRVETASVDFIINLEGKRFMTVKCSLALDSRERHILAFSRVVDSYQIPLAVVTDGKEVRMIDTVSGKTISEDINSIPSRQEALSRIKDVEFREYPAEKMEKEKRILMAFECISCPVDKS